MVQMQGERRPTPGQPAIRRSRLCLILWGSAVLLIHLLLASLSNWQEPPTDSEGGQEGLFPEYLLPDGWSLLHQMSSFSCLRVYLPNHSQFWRLLSAFRTLELERAPKAWFANSVQSTGFTHQVEVPLETQHWNPPSVDKSYIPSRTLPPSSQHLRYPKPFLTASITTWTPQTMLDP